MVLSKPREGAMTFAEPGYRQPLSADEAFLIAAALVWFVLIVAAAIRLAGAMRRRFNSSADGAAE
jgi:hypothetical protein